MNRLRRWRDMWGLGALAVLACGFSALLFGGLALLALNLLSMAMDAAGMPPLPEPAIYDLLALTGVLWLPLAIGAVLPTLFAVMKDRLAQIAASKRDKEMESLLAASRR